MTKTNWQYTTLGGVCLKITDGSHWSPKGIDQGVPMASVKDMTDFGFNISTCKLISFEDYQKLIKNDCKPLRDDVLIAKDGSYLKHVFVWKQEVDLAILSSIAILRPNKNLIEPQFLAKYLMSSNTKAEMTGYVSGAALPRIILKDFINFRILIPPLPTQHKIAAILSAYDDLIENNLRWIKILEDMAQSLYREWFVKFRFPGHEKVQMVDSPPGKIPEGWEVIKVGGLLEKVRRKKKLKKQYYETDGPIPVVDQGRDFIGGYTTDPETLFDSPLPIIVFGDHTRVLKYVDFPFACGADGTQLLRPNTEQMPISLFYYVLKSIDLSDFAYARHFKFLKEQEVLVPNEQITRLFAQVADPVRDLIRCLLSRNTNLRRTRDLLLPKLISGKLDVSDLDIKTGGHMQ